MMEFPEADVFKQPLHFGDRHSLLVFVTFHLITDQMQRVQHSQGLSGGGPPGRAEGVGGTIGSAVAADSILIAASHAMVDAFGAHVVPRVMSAAAASMRVSP